MSLLVRLGLSAVLVCAVSCNKQGGTNTPDGGRGGKGAPAEGGIELRYGAAAAKLKQNGSIDMNTSGSGQFGQAAMEYSALLEFSPSGDKLKVVWSFADIGKLDLQGMFKDDGGGDTKSVLVAQGKGAFLVDRRGELDEKATEGLAENTARREHFKKLGEEAKANGGKPPAGAGAAQILALADAMIALPDLPKDPIAIGKTVVEEEQAETELGGSGVMMPTDTETKYTLVKIDDSGGQRIAELQVEQSTSGASEMQGGMISLEGTIEGSILFDVDAGLPVSYKFTRSTMISFGQNSFETTMMMQASFEKG